jgi:hypothetical protein
MTGLDVLLALAGIGVTAMVIVGMVLITPRGVVDVHAEGTDSQGSNLSSTTPAPDPSLPMPTKT